MEPLAEIPLEDLEMMQQFLTASIHCIGARRFFPFHFFPPLLSVSSTSF